MPEVSAILVTFNRLPLLKEAISALLNVPEKLDIFVINNASTDETQIWLNQLQAALALARQRKDPDVLFEIGVLIQGNGYLNKKLFVEHLDVNLGGAGGFWMGMNLAHQNGYDYYWLMDDDTIVGPESLTALLSAAKGSESLSENPPAFYSSRALWTDGMDNRMNAQRLLEKDRGQNHLKIREATFVSLLVPHASIEEHGFPIPEFFIWGDDIEYTRRLSQKIPGMLVRESQVLHKTANNAGSDISKDDLNRLGRYFYAYRNEVFMARKEGLKRMIRQMAKILYHSGRVLVLSDNKSSRLKMIWSSSKEGLGFNPQVPQESDFESLFLKLNGRRYNG